MDGVLSKDKAQEVGESMTEMPPPPPSPSATRDLPMLPNEALQKLQNSGNCSHSPPPPYSPQPDVVMTKQQHHNNCHFFSNSPDFTKRERFENSFTADDITSKKKLGHRRMPSDVCIDLEKSSPRHAGIGTSPYKTHSPRSAGYNYRANPHNSFEFPPPPPEFLRQTSEPGQEKHRVRFQDFPSSSSLNPKYQGLVHTIIDPLNPAHRRPHKVSDNMRCLAMPKQDYGSFSSRILNAKPPTEDTVVLDQNPLTPKHGRKDEKTYFELEPEPTVPYEYGYSVKTGQKFKVYHGNGKGSSNGKGKKIFEQTPSIPKAPTLVITKNRSGSVSGNKKQRVITNSTV